MGFRETVFNARSYSDAESTRQASFGLLPQVIPEFTLFKGVTFNADGSAQILIEQGHATRRIDPPVVFFCEIAMWLGARFRLNSRGPNKAAGEDNVYPRLDIPGGGLRARLNMQLNRIVADPGPGQTVRENPNDHRNHLKEGLRIEAARTEYGSGKSRYTRWDVIEAILGAFDRAIPATIPFITRDELRDLLTGLLILADGRATERQASKERA